MGRSEEWREFRKYRKTLTELRSIARDMRREPTPAELMLWSRLRRKRLEGLKFRFQHPVGNFILDFYCPMVKLVVEVDGPIHDEQTERDAARTALIEAHGYHVLRLTNDEVINHVEDVLARILAKAKELYVGQHGTYSWFSDDDAE